MATVQIEKAYVPVGSDDRPQAAVQMDYTPPGYDVEGGGPFSHYVPHDAILDRMAVYDVDEKGALELCVLEIIGSHDTDVLPREALKKPFTPAEHAAIRQKHKIVGLEQAHRHLPRFDPAAVEERTSALAHHREIIARHS